MSTCHPLALEFSAYRRFLDADYSRLRSLAPAALALPVPGCPGWIVEDVVRHVATVYLHKAEAIRTQVMPDAGWPPEWLLEGDALEVLGDCHGRLMDEFNSHLPGDHAETWWPEDQTVGFWIRRMAHETAVHRRDVENAAGRPGPANPELAADGIDEVLALMLAGDWSGGEVAAASGAVVAVESAGHMWTVQLNPSDVGLARTPMPGRSPDATVFGGPGEVLLWLWGRAPLPGFTGDPRAVAELRARLVLATA